MERDNDSAAPLREMNALREETKILCGKELCKINVTGSEGEFFFFFSTTVVCCSVSSFGKQRG